MILITLVNILFHQSDDVFNINFFALDLNSETWLPTVTSESADMPILSVLPAFTWVSLFRS